MAKSTISIILHGLFILHKYSIFIYLLNSIIVIVVVIGIILFFNLTLTSIHTSDLKFIVVVCHFMIFTIINTVKIMLIHFFNNDINYFKSLTYNFLIYYDL